MTISHASRTWLSQANCNLDDFKRDCARETDASQLPHAADIQKKVPLYDAASLRAACSADEAKRRALLAEWAYVLESGPGAFVIKGAYPDTQCIDDATDVFLAIIEEERAHSSGGDHFAAKGANDRIWNSLQKLCLRAPQVFAPYHGNDMACWAAEAWLGPNFQMTAQVNLVRPGGQAQQPHRDYHLGFQPVALSETFPAQVHRLSPFMTLQGGIAHCDMPLESGPTQLLPFSQNYEAGYLAYHRADFRAFAEENFIQLPLEKGDLIFFSPALFHAAGTNRSQDIRRLVNLLQVSSPYGRAMEAVDRVAMSKALFPVLVSQVQSGLLSQQAAGYAMACCAEGYAFPTNLDTDPPIGGMAPRTQVQLMQLALEEGWDAARFAQELDAQEAKRRA